MKNFSTFFLEKFGWYCGNVVSLQREMSVSGLWHGFSVEIGRHYLAELYRQSNKVRWPLSWIFCLSMVRLFSQSYNKGLNKYTPLRNLSNRDKSVRSWQCIFLCAKVAEMSRPTDKSRHHVAKQKHEGTKARKSQRKGNGNTSLQGLKNGKATKSKINRKCW